MKSVKVFLIFVVTMGLLLPDLSFARGGRGGNGGASFGRPQGIRGGGSRGPSGSFSGNRGGFRGSNNSSFPGAFSSQGNRGQGQMRRPRSQGRSGGLRSSFPGAFASQGSRGQQGQMRRPPRNRQRISSGVNRRPQGRQQMSSRGQQSSYPGAFSSRGRGQAGLQGRQPRTTRPQFSPRATSSERNPSQLGRSRRSDRSGRGRSGGIGRRPYRSNSGSGQALRRPDSSGQRRYGRDYRRGGEKYIANAKKVNGHNDRNKALFNEYNSMRFKGQKIKDKSFSTAILIAAAQLQALIDQLQSAGYQTQQTCGTPYGNGIPYANTGCQGSGNGVPYANANYPSTNDGDYNEQYIDEGDLEGQEELTEEELDIEATDGRRFTAKRPIQDRN